jgi:predicted TIM-barrel fold metal-dependent hydrolase
MNEPAENIPVIDTHIHLFDPTRPQGVPWPEKDDAVLYHTALPDRYRQVTKGFGIVGAIEVEASTWLEDNQWVLDIAARDTLILGTVGDLEPGKPDFPKHLERFRKNPMFFGIRCGNLWGRDLATQVFQPDFVADLKLVADAGLEMDTANPDPALIEAVVRLTDRVPNLRVVIDHLPQLNPPSDAAGRKALEDNLHELGKRPQVYVKISSVLRHVNGKVPDKLDFYRAGLDQLWEIFGEDRLIYGSDWPHSDLWGPYPEVFKIVREYFAGKSHEAQEKYFWKNSLAAYRWKKRNASQPPFGSAA